MTPIRNLFDRFFGNSQVVILISVIMTFLLVGYFKKPDGKEEIPWNR